MHSTLVLGSERLTLHPNSSSSFFRFNMAEAEQAPRSLPVLAEIPARVQGLDNPLPRAPEAELVQADRAGPANDLAQPVEVLFALCLFVSGSTYVSCAMRLFFLLVCFVRGSLPSSPSCSSGRALVCRVIRPFCQFSFFFLGYSLLFFYTCLRL